MKQLVRFFAFACVAALTAGQGAAATLDGRVPLTQEHVDLRILYAPGTTNALYLVARDEDHATNYASTNVVLMVGRSAEVTLPEGFPEFGEPGAPFWILPASQDPQLLYVGFSAEGLPRNTFDEPLAIQLVDVRAPGSFFVYQFGAGGGLEMKMDSRNGIGPGEAVHPIVGSHAHFNWGFSSNGFYEVTFRVEGRLRGATTNLPAANTSFLFAVEPLPPAPPAPAMLANVAVTDAQLTCELIGTPGVTYRVQTSSDLLTWSNGPEVLGAATPVPVAVPLTEIAAPRFLRAFALSP